MVTGNHGYIGHILADELVKSGYTVGGYDLDYFPKDVFGREDTLLSSPKILQVTKDIRDVTIADLKGYDAIFHLAGLPNDPAGDLNPSVTEDINYLATVQLATTAKRAGVKRFIFASSCSVYGVNGDSMINENSDTYPITPYAVSKLKSEKALLSMSSSEFAVTCMRNATCYGVSPRMRFDMVLNNFIGYAVTEGKIKILSDGSSWRPLVHVEDISRAYLTVLESDVNSVGSEVFSIGSENFKISDLATVVSKSIPSAEVEYAKGGTKDMRSYRVNFSKFHKMTGFLPLWDAKRGARELFDAYLHYGLNSNNFMSKSFWAGNYFKFLLDSGVIDNNFRFKA
ncbi:MAG: NAD-dependent epimerase/dehydratase family protein [Thermoplasmataceae archaeon]